MPQNLRRPVQIVITNFSFPVRPERRAASALTGLSVKRPSLKSPARELVVLDGQNEPVIKQFAYSPLVFYRKLLHPSVPEKRSLFTRPQIEPYPKCLKKTKDLQSAFIISSSITSKGVPDYNRSNNDFQSRFLLFLRIIDILK